MLFPASVQGPSQLSLVNPIFGTFIFDVLLDDSEWFFADVERSLHMFN